MMKSVLATTSSFNTRLPEIHTILQKYDLQIVGNPYGRKLTEEELEDLLEKYRPVALLAGTEPITERLLDKAKDHLRVISRIGAGWDNVDKVAADRLGIPVYRTEGILTDAVAELTIGMILTALRYVVNHDRQMHSACWEKIMGSLLRGKTLGIIGFGAIGRRVGKLAQAFGAEVVFAEPQNVSVDWARRLSIEDLLRSADIVSLHADGKELILGANQLENICKRGVVIVNTARGSLVDEQVLIHCLRNGQVGYACLDVFTDEPYHGPLCTLDNVILTPHIGSYAGEVRQRMELMAVENLISGLQRVDLLERESS